EEDIRRLEAEIERAESAHQATHFSYTRLAGVSKARPNLVAQQEIDEALARDRVSEAQVSTAKAALAAAQQQLEQARANEGKMKTILAYSRITAPFSGVITKRFADTGAMIQAGTSSSTQAMPLVRLSQNDRLRLVLPAPESVVPQIRVGSVIRVDVASL